MTTVNVVCYKSKVLRNNESPLMLRVTKDRKCKYVSLGISVMPENWDFKLNKPNPNCPNKEYIELIITNKVKEYQTKVVEMKATNQEFTSTTLVEKTRNPKCKKSVGDVFLDFIDNLLLLNRRGYANSIKQAYNSLTAFNKHLNIPFEDINLSWLNKYEIWLRYNKKSENTIGIYFRSLRVIYNVAIKEQIVKKDLYPFASYKVSKLKEETVKRALKKEDVERVINYACTNNFMKFPIDIFAFTYYAGGINFVDIANLTETNIIDGRLIYRRQKTGKLIKLPLQPQALKLIEKYHTDDSPYLFPILSPLHKTEVQKLNRIHKAISNVNEWLKRIGKELNLPITLTTYVARHSQATVMKKAGVPTAIISQIMGHSSEQVTKYYLDSFENEQINEAMSRLSL